MGVPASTVLYYYVLLLWFASFGSIVVALLNLKLGIRHWYLATLEDLFTIVAKWCRRQDDDEDEEEMHDCDGDVYSCSSEESFTAKDPESGEEVIVPRKISYIPTVALARQRSVQECTLKRMFSHEDEPLFVSLVKDTCKWSTAAINSVVSDDFTDALSIADLPTWNLLARQRQCTVLSDSMTLRIIIVLTTFFRYFFLLPTRLLILAFAMAFLMITSKLASCFPKGISTWLEEWLHIAFFRLLSRCFSLCATYHNPENKAKPGGICVANHTSLVDAVTLGADNHYALVGQKHGGMLGTIEVALGRLARHIWLERGEKKSRENTVQRLKDHVEAQLLPVLLFPEGVCVNNTKMLRFRKGSFEIGATMYPVAIKYDRRFGDPFWVEASWLEHMFKLATCWGVRADVYYMEPMTRGEGESGEDFSNRVKNAIADKGSFVQVDWDGFLQYKPEMSNKQADNLKAEYSNRVRHLSGRGNPKKLG